MSIAMPFFKSKRVKQEDHRNVVLGTSCGRFFKNKEILTEAELNHHVHIVGASGYGKTVLLSHIIKNKIQNGQGLLFVDLKGDIETIQNIRGLARHSNREKDLQVFSLTDNENSSSYNLIQDGTPTQLRDKIMLSLTWSEEYYKNQSASFLLKALIGLTYLRDRGNPFSLETILQLVTTNDYVAELATQIPEGCKAKSAMENCYEFLSDRANYASLQGLRTQLESLILSDFGERLTVYQGNEISLFESVTKGKIVLILLDTRRYGESAKTIGRFLLQDLKMTSARIDSEIPKSERKPFTVIIDEFADLAQEDFIGFLDRARSSKMAIVVAHQELSDLKRISPEFAARLTGNTSTLYAFLQKNPESAEMISGMAGTKTVWKETLKSERFLWWSVPTGDKSLREVEEFNIHPNMIKSLRVGNCIAIKKYPHSSSRFIQIFHPQPAAGSPHEGRTRTRSVV